MKSPVRLLILSTIALIFFGVATFFLRGLIFGDVVGTYEQAAANRSEYNDRWVSTEVVACLGKYAEKTESTNFIPTGHEYYYLIWMKDGSFMPISVSKKADREYLDALTNATYDYIDKKTKDIAMDPKTFIGTVKSQETKAKNYYDEALTKMKIKGNTTHTIYYELMDCSSSKTHYRLLVGGVLLVPVLGYAVAFANIAKAKKKPSKEEEYLPR
ncbi:MAG: hypothetical protein IKT20_05820 [Clostridiales bacterium]|nr:hypothetical protein [Clostridiales bacterium]MBR6488408.1 hypothetical protein [Clostridiales bacterium]